MRDIRSRIAKRHGIDLTPQQIHELAARRLEAILEPRHVSPSLMEQMRRSAGEAIEVPSPSSEAPSALFDESSLYASHRGFLGRLRRWLNPVLKLFINPAPLVEAIRAQERRSQAAAAREAELYARQAEWNALHFEILQRLVTEVSRTTLETQAMALRIESLAAKVDFNERRVRGIESGTYQSAKPASRSAEPAPAEGVRPSAPSAPEGTQPAASGTEGAASPEGTRRRRRRRRGRRSGLPPSAGPAPTATDVAAAGIPELDVDDADGDSEGDLEGEGDSTETAPAVESTVSERGAEAASLEPADTFSQPQPAEQHQSPETDSFTQTAPEPAAAPTPEPPVQPTPPRDEPVPPAPVDRADPGPPDR